MTPIEAQGPQGPQEQSDGRLRAAVTRSSSRPRATPFVVLFALMGAGMGTWAGRIPAVKAGLHLSAGTLGAALLGPAVGALVAMPITASLLDRVRAERLIGLACFPFGAGLALLGWANSAVELFGVLTVWGMAFGVLDIAMNTKAATYEQHRGQRVMSRFHAAFSVGGLAGAGCAALAAGLAIDARANFVAAGITIVVVGTLTAARFSPDRVKPKATTPGRSWPERSWALAALALMAFGCFLAEGATTDWGAVYLHTDLGTSTSVAAVAYTAFASTMAVGRLTGDHLAARFGPRRLVRVSCSIAACAFLLILLARSTPVAMAGFVLLGAGLSFVIPQVLSAASRLRQPAPSLAAVVSCGYLGLLIGPPVIGGLADATSLRLALGLVVALCVLTAVAAGAVNQPARLTNSDQISRV